MDFQPLVEYAKDRKGISCECVRSFWVITGLRAITSACTATASEDENTQDSIVPELVRTSQTRDEPLFVPWTWTLAGTEYQVSAGQRWTSLMSDSCNLCGFVQFQIVCMGEMPCVVVTTPRFAPEKLWDSHHLVDHLDEEDHPHGFKQKPESVAPVARQVLRKTPYVPKQGCSRADLGHAR